MAHNNKTPKSVLDAPKRTYEFVKDTEFSGSNRRERRWLGYGLREVKRFKAHRHWLRVLTEEKKATSLEATNDNKE